MSTSRIQKLLSFKEDHPNGGFEWTGYDLSEALEAAIDDPEFACIMVRIPPQAPLAPQSRFRFGSGEDYVKRVILEELGVLAQIKCITQTKYGQTSWIMSGVCPFHRRVHSRQNWLLCEGKPGQPTFARCMKPLKRFTASVHYPTKKIGDLELMMAEEKHKDRVY